MSKFRLKSYDNHMISSYKRMKDGIFMNENFKHYTKEFFEEVLRYLEVNEMYEQCAILQKIINNRFDHNLNYIQYELR